MSNFPMAARAASGCLQLVVLFQLREFMTWSQSKPCCSGASCQSWLVLPVIASGDKKQRHVQCFPPVRSEAFQQCTTMMHLILAKLLWQEAASSMTFCLVLFNQIGLYGIFVTSLASLDEVRKKEPTIHLETVLRAGDILPWNHTGFSGWL